MKELVFGVTAATYPTFVSGRERKIQGPTPQIATTQQVAIWNEYGTEKIPPRPAFRRGIEHALAINKKLIGSQLQNITRRILSGRAGEVDKSLIVLLTQIGKSAKAETKRIIKSGDETPNAPATVAKKGFNHPLFETGLLLEHVDYEVKG